MKFKFLLYIVFALLPQVLMAQVMIIEHQPQDGLSQGDIVQGIIEVGGDLSLISPSELVGKDIGRTFHIFRASQEGPLYRLGLAVSPWAGPGDSLFLDWRNKKILIEVRDVKFKSLASPFKDEVFVEGTPWDDGKISWKFFLGILTSGILVSLIFYFLFRSLSEYLVKRRIKIRTRALRAKWEQVFGNAKSREDLESIYKKRKKWLCLIEESESVLKFFEMMNRHQYKPHWTKESELEVRQSFEKIQNIFRGQE